MHNNEKKTLRNNKVQIWSKCKTK